MGTIFEEAAGLVNGDRREDYGDIKKSLDKISDLWAGYLGIPISVSDFIHMMILLKVSRASHSLKRDNYVDIAGYILCLEKYYEEELKTTIPEPVPESGIEL